MRTTLQRTNRNRLMAGAAVAVLVIGGAAAAVMLNRPSGTTEAQAGPAEEKAHAGEEGVVHLTADQLTAAGISVVAVGRGGGGETRLAGRVEPMVDARAAVAAPVAGSVQRVLVAPGQSVRAGQALVLLMSGDAAALRADVDAASATAQAARQVAQRDQNLLAQGIVPRQEAETSRAQALSAEATARAARARAIAAGSPTGGGTVGVASPIAGVVTQVQVGPGGFVAQGGVVAMVTNPDRLELVFSAPPQLVAQVAAGSTLRATGPGGEFEATVTGIAADAGPSGSGAAVIRARPTHGALPPAGSPVTGAVTTGAQTNGLSVPSEAVQSVEGRAVVFVRSAEGFRAVPVLPGRQAAGRTEILQGLAGDERIAGVGAFLLKAELAKGDAEHGH